MMMALGMFVFSLPTLAYQDLARRTSWRHEQVARYRARAANQFLGPGEDRFTLSGVLLPELAGDPNAMQTLRGMGDDGEAYALVDGRGVVHGAFVITDLDERGALFFQDGVARKTDWTIELLQVDAPEVTTGPVPIAPPEDL